MMTRWCSVIPLARDARTAVNYVKRVFPLRMASCCRKSTNIKKGASVMFPLNIELHECKTNAMF